MDCNGEKIAVKYNTITTLNKPYKVSWFIPGLLDHLCTIVFFKIPLCMNIVIITPQLFSVMEITGKVNWFVLKWQGSSIWKQFWRNRQIPCESAGQHFINLVLKEQNYMATCWIPHHPSNFQEVLGKLRIFSECLKIFPCFSLHSKQGF